VKLRVPTKLQHEKNDNASKKRKRQNESTHAATTQKNNDNASKKRKRQNESTDAAATRNVNNNSSRKRKRQRQQQNFSTMSHDEEMSHAIERAMKEAKQILHRTQNPTNPQSHRAIVCIICDQFNYWYRENSQTFKLPDFSTHQ
jgi:hypothetical protein